MKAPTNYLIQPTDRNKWFGIIEDTTCVGTFAVLSKRCLEFKDPEIAHLCLSNDIENHGGFQKTCLFTRILPRSSPQNKWHQLQIDCSNPFNGLSLGTDFRVWKTYFALKRDSRGCGRAFVATANTSPFCAISCRGAPGFREWVNPELKGQSRSIPMVICT